MQEIFLFILAYYSNVEYTGYMKKTTKAHTATSAALKFWLKKSGMTQGELAEKIGLDQSTLSNMIRGVRGIKAEYIEKLCEIFGISMAEFFACDSGDLPEIVFVPLVSAMPKAGLGSLQMDDEQLALYSFHSSFINRKSGTTDSMRLFRVEGNSMQPTIDNNDMIMVNLLQTEVRQGAIYLIRFEGELMVKRLERRAGGVVLIRSDNPAYEDIPVNPENESVDFEIFGKMVWLCREF